MAEPAATAREILRPLLRVRQVREFTTERIEAPILDAIADVARWSGSSLNEQPWRFITITDEALLRQIHGLSLPQTRSFATAQAGIAIVLPDDPTEAISRAYDEGRAAERILEAANYLGLGAAIAWIFPRVMPTIREWLDVPDDRIVRTIVALGHPTEAALAPKSAPGAARLPRGETVFSERFGRKG